MSIKTKLQQLMKKAAEAIAPEPEPPATPVQKEREKIQALEQSRLSQKERAIEGAKERARRKAKELGYPDDAIEKALSNRAVVVGSCPWLEQYLDELVQINSHFSKSCAEEMDADFRAQGANPIILPKPDAWWRLKF